MPEENQTDMNEQVENTAQGEEQPEALSTSNEPTESVEENTADLPEDVKERTKEQFEKLKEHNAKLKAELEQRKQLPSVLDYLSPSLPTVQPEVRAQYQPTPIPTPQPQEPQLVDEQGYINADELQRQMATIREAQKRAEEAERQALEAQQRIARFEQDAETKKLYAEYPELDPMNKTFNEQAYRLVRDRLTSQIVETGKRDALKAAQEMSQYFRSTPKPVDEVIEQRHQATPASGKQLRQSSATSLEELRLRSRNDPDAVAERLRRLGI